MIKYTHISFTALLCVVLAGAAFAAIGSSGGTEDFESVGSLTNGDQITAPLISNISGWDYYETCDSPIYYYDTDDTTGFSTAAGAGTKPSGAGCLRVYSTASGIYNHRIGSTQMSLGRDITMSAWFAVKTTPSNTGQFLLMGLHFPGWGAVATQASAWLMIETATRDIRLRVKREISASGANEDLYVGTGAMDNTDYDLNTWNKLEVSVTSSDSATGQIQFSLNGDPVGSPVAIKSDPSGHFMTPRCSFPNWAAITVTEVYFDDITVQSGSGFDDWILMD